MYARPVSKISISIDILEKVKSGFPNTLAKQPIRVFAAVLFRFQEVENGLRHKIVCYVVALTILKFTTT